MAGEWDTVVQQWLVDPGACTAGGLANQSDCAFYAAAPVEGEAGWSAIYKDPHEELIMQEDGSEKPTTITESETLAKAVAEGRCPGGLWLGGNKYTCVQFERDMEIAGNQCMWVLAIRPKAGVHIIATGTSVAVGMYSEEAGQSSGNCKNHVIAFAEYLVGAGY